MKQAYTAATVFAGFAIAQNIPFTAPPILNPVDYISNSAELDSFSTAYISDVESYHSSLTKNPEWSKFLSDVSTAIGGGSGYDQWASSVLDGDLGDSGNTVDALATPSWWTQIPTSAQALYTSVQGDGVSIFNKDLTAAGGSGGSAPTGTGGTTGSKNAAAAVITPAPLAQAAAIVGAGAIAGAALLL